MMVWSQEVCMCCSLFFEFWVQGWYLWVTFGDRVGTTGCFLSLTSLLLETAFMSKIPLCPWWHCSLTQVLLFCPRAQSQEEKLGVESWRALLGNSGQSFPALCVSIEWATTVMLRFYCFHFFFFFPTPPPCQLLKQHGRVADCLVMACFPAELSTTVATCWKPLLVPEDVCLRQQQSHFLADKCSMPLKWFASSWWRSSICRFKAFFWPNSATLYCSSFERARWSCGCSTFGFCWSC